MQEMEIFLKVVTSVPLIDNHDANSVTQFPCTEQCSIRFSCIASLLTVLTFWQSYVILDLEIYGCTLIEDDCLVQCNKLFLMLLFQLNQAIGSIQAIAKASKEYILESADLSFEKAEMVVKFSVYPKLYPGPKIN